jgi:3-deoxy-D-manno-octulosonic acid kinase
MQEQELRSQRGAILYDADLLRKASPAAIESLFDLEHWRAQGALDAVAGGRGTVAFIRRAEGDWVLRHYRRGGLIARVVSDRYAWTGAARTRSFAEWRLLAQLRAWELPVPEPVAARYLRRGLAYRADLLTSVIPDVTTLARLVGEARVEPQTWRQVGATIARLHERGVHHADLNAHNVLIDRSGAVFVIDFDRGRIRSRGAWEQRVLDRLHRSLVKVAGGNNGFNEAAWRELLAGYSD